MKLTLQVVIKEIKYKEISYRPISCDATKRSRRAVCAACFVEDEEAFFYT